MNEGYEKKTEDAYFLLFHNHASQKSGNEEMRIWDGIAITGKEKEHSEHCA